MSLTDNFGSWFTLLEMFYIILCTNYSVVNNLNVSFNGLITSFGEERADFPAINYL